MLLTFLPVTKDGQLYQKAKNINRYTPCMILTKEEHKELLRFHKLISTYRPSPVLGEMLHNPIVMEKDYGKEMKAGSYVVYLYQDLSPRAASLIRKRGGVLRAFLEDIDIFHRSMEFLSNDTELAEYFDNHEEEVNMMETLYNASLPMSYMLGMI